MRLSSISVGMAAVSLVIAGPCAAAKKKPEAVPAAAPAAAAAAQGAADPSTVVATVGGQKITLGDLNAAAQEVPPQARQMPPQQLYPLLLDRLIDSHVLVIAARKQGLQNDPMVKEQMARADDNVLQTALLRRDIAPQLTETALRSAYDKEIGTKPGEDEVQASHILVATEAQAKDIIAQLDKGADFAALAKKFSTDPTGAQSGGDLGYFKKGDMVPEFSTAAFAMKPGEITQAPVKTRYGYHVIKVTNRRKSPPPSFADAQQQLQQEMVQKLISAEIAKAKAGVVIERKPIPGFAAAAAPAAAPAKP